MPNRQAQRRVIPPSLSSKKVPSPPLSPFCISNYDEIFSPPPDLANSYNTAAIGHAVKLFAGSGRGFSVRPVGTHQHVICADLPDQRGYVFLGNGATRTSRLARCSWHQLCGVFCHHR
jgi:hypothetical protein